MSEIYGSGEGELTAVRGKRCFDLLKKKDRKKCTFKPMLQQCTMAIHHIFYVLDYWVWYLADCIRSIGIGIELS